MENEKKQIELEDYCLKYEEMRDSMLQSLMNIEKIIKQQKKLVDIVSTAIHDYEDKEKQPFDEFCKETESQIKRLESQKEILGTRVGLLTAVLEKCNNNAGNAELISMLSEALGIFKQE